MLKDYDFKEFNIKQNSNLVNNFEININQLSRIDKKIIFLNLFLKKTKLTKYFMIRKIISKKIKKIRFKLWLEYLNLINNNLDLVISLPAIYGGIPGRVFESVLLNKKVIFIVRNDAVFYRNLFKKQGLNVLVLNKNEVFLNKVKILKYL